MALTSKANIAGMGEALELDIGNRYSIVTMICLLAQFLVKRTRTWSLIVTVFVPYALIALCATQIMKIFGASVMTPTVVLYVYLPAICRPRAYGFDSAFGLFTLSQGFIQSWGALAAIRFMLGLFEGLMLPSTLFRKIFRPRLTKMSIILIRGEVLQVWYTRYEFHKRYGTEVAKYTRIAKLH